MGQNSKSWDIPDLEGQDQHLPNTRCCKNTGSPFSFNRIYCFFLLSYSNNIYSQKKFKTIQKNHNEGGNVSHNSITQRKLPFPYSKQLFSSFYACTDLFIK